MIITKYIPNYRLIIVLIVSFFTITSTILNWTEEKNTDVILVGAFIITSTILIVREFIPKLCKIELKVDTLRIEKNKMIYNVPIKKVESIIKATTKFYGLTGFSRIYYLKTTNTANKETRYYFEVKLEGSSLSFNSTEPEELVYLRKVVENK